MSYTGSNSIQLMASADTVDDKAYTKHRLNADIEPVFSMITGIAERDLKGQRLTPLALRGRRLG